MSDEALVEQDVARRNSMTGAVLLVVALNAVVIWAVATWNPERV
ncbi:MAG: hypothetical protein WBA81_06110 [Rhodococcus sp. (in: high G+C Gram-positive bacteria)]